MECVLSALLSVPHWVASLGQMRTIDCLFTPSIYNLYPLITHRKACSVILLNSHFKQEIQDFQEEQANFTKQHLTAYSTLHIHFQPHFYSLLTSLKSYELTSLIADQLFQITCILRRLLDRCSCWDFRRWSIIASSLVLLFVYDFYVL